MAITSNGLGGPFKNWSAGSSWAGGVAPGPADDAIILAVDSINYDSDIIHTGNITYAGALRGTGTRKLTLSGTAQLTRNAGGSLSSSGGKFTIQIGTDHNQSCRWAINGTSGDRAAITGESSANYISPEGGSGFLRGGQVQATYADFSNVKDAGNEWYAYLSGSGNTFSFENCTFSGCGRHVIQGGHADAIIRMNDSHWTNSAHSTDSCHWTELVNNAKGASGVRQCIGSTFDKAFGNSASAGHLRDVTIEYNVFYDKLNYTGNATSVPASLRYNVIRRTTAVDMGTWGDVRDNFFLCDFATSNPHFFEADSYTGRTISDNLLQYTGTGGDGDGIIMSSSNPTGSVVRHTVTGNIILPRSDGLGGSCTLVSGAHANQQTNRVANNTTYVSSGTRNALQVNETIASSAGMHPLVENNLTVSLGVLNGGSSPEAGTYVVSYPSTAGVDNIITPSGARNNGNYGLALANAPGKTNHNTPYNTPTTGTTPGANDVNGVNPGFVDRSRNFEWYATIYSLSASVANTLAVLKADPRNRIPDMLSKIRAGHAPTATAYKGTAFDGGDIGAVPVASVNHPFYFAHNVAGRRA